MLHQYPRGPVNLDPWFFREVPRISKPIDVLYNAAERHQVPWEDEDMLCVTCSYIENLMEQGIVTPEHFDNFIRATIVDDIEAIKAAEM